MIGNFIESNLLLSGFIFLLLGVIQYLYLVDLNRSKEKNYKHKFGKNIIFAIVCVIFGIILIIRGLS